MNSFIYRESGKVYDVTEFIKNGIYYFHCNKKMLVRINPIGISRGELLKREIRFGVPVGNDVKYAQDFFRKSTDWADGFTYKYTSIIPGNPTFIAGDNFERLIEVEGACYIVSLGLAPGRINSAAIHVSSFNPDSYVTYEQLREEAKSSCEWEQ